MTHPQHVIGSSSAALELVYVTVQAYAQGEEAARALPGDQRADHAEDM